MEDKKNDYTLKEEQIARFAKALGHPARVAILHFLAKREACYFGGDNMRIADSEGYRFPASEGVERGPPHPLPGLLLCGAQPHGGDPGNPPHQGYHRRGHPDFPEPHSPGYV